MSRFARLIRVRRYFASPALDPCDFVAGLRDAGTLGLLLEKHLKLGDRFLWAVFLFQGAGSDVVRHRQLLVWQAMYLAGASNGCVVVAVQELSLR